MEPTPSAIAGVDLLAPGLPEFHAALAGLLGREPDDAVTPALPYSVIARNGLARAIALLGTRFDMTGPDGRAYSVVHYADTLRHPEKAALRPGSLRFVCAEPRYTDLVLHGGREVDARGPMNLENLRRMREIRCSIDCVAFDDGEFAGPDSLGAFDRFEAGRRAEIALIEELPGPLAVVDEAAIEDVLQQALEPGPGEARDYALLARRALARRFREALTSGGMAEFAARARSHRPRIPLRRSGI